MGSPRVGSNPTGVDFAPGMLPWRNAALQCVYKHACHAHGAWLQRMCMLLRVPGLLVVARKLTTAREILLWMTPSEAPKALQASECSELLDPMRASCWISTQH